MVETMATVWDTPFTYSSYPSVGLLMEPDGDGSALLIVAPGGLDAYPKYLVHFTNVLATTCGEEAGFALDLGQNQNPGDVAAHIWDASPYSASYANTVFGAGKYIRHYVVFGGDNIVSVVAGEPPSIEVVASPTELVVRHAI